MTTARWDAGQLEDYARRIPFNRWLDLRVTSVGDDGVVITIPWREELGGAPETEHVHGGVLAAIVDLAAGLSVIAGVGHGGPTVDMRADFHRGAVAGPMEAHGRVIRAGRTIAFAEVSLRDRDGNLVATGRGVFYVGSGKQFRPAERPPA